MKNIYTVEIHTATMHITHSAEAKNVVIATRKAVAKFRHLGATLANVVSVVQE